MSKFKIKTKLQGLELEIEGTREDSSNIGRNLGGQLANLLQPAIKIIDGEASSAALPPAEAVLPPASPRKSRRRRSAASSPASEEAATTAIDFKHDPEKFGNPTQTWKTAEKATWLLYVVKEAAGLGELSTRSLVETFNKHFRQAGTITTSNVTRDLGRLKSRHKPPPVGEDTSKPVPTWFLTEEGRKRAQGLVAEALGQAS